MRKPQSQPNMFCQPRSCTDTHPYLRGTTESICIYLFLNVLGYCIAHYVQYNDFKNTYNILLRMYSTKGTCTSTYNYRQETRQSWRFDDGGRKEWVHFPSQPTICTSPKYSFSRKKIPRRRHLACCMHTYCRSRKACLIQTGYVQVEPCTCTCTSTGTGLPSQEYEKKKKKSFSIRTIPDTCSLSRWVFSVMAF